MAENRSLIVYGHLQEAEQKFDYFVAGMTGALCAFLVEGYHANKLGLNAATIELVALVLLIISFLFGLRRISLCINCRRYNFAALDASERQDILKASASNWPEGETFIPDELLTLITKFGRNEKRINEALVKIQKKTALAFSLRNWFLIAGFAVLVAARIINAYI